MGLFSYFTGQEAKPQISYGASLASMGAAVDQYDEASQQASQRSMDMGIRAGELLCQMKDQAEPGKWLETLRANCKTPARRAQRYMKMYRYSCDVTSHEERIEEWNRINGNTDKEEPDAIPTPLEAVPVAEPALAPPAPGQAQDPEAAPAPQAQVGYQTEPPAEEGTPPISPPHNEVRWEPAEDALERQARARRNLTFTVLDFELHVHCGREPSGDDLKEVARRWLEQLEAAYPTVPVGQAA